MDEHDEEFRKFEKRIRARRKEVKEHLRTGRGLRRCCPECSCKEETLWGCDWLIDGDGKRIRDDLRWYDHFLRGEVLFRLFGRFDAALQDYQVAQRLCPEISDIPFRIGSILFCHLNRPAEALRAFTRVIELDEDETKTPRADPLLDTGEEEEGEDDTDDTDDEEEEEQLVLVVEQPQQHPHPFVYRLRAICLRELGCFDTTILEDHRRDVALCSSVIEYALLESGITKLRMGSLLSALTDFDEAIERSGYLAMSALFEHRGMVHFQLKQFKKARSDFKKRLSSMTWAVSKGADKMTRLLVFLGICCCYDDTEKKEEEEEDGIEAATSAFGEAFRIEPEVGKATLERICSENEEIKTDLQRVFLRRLVEAGLDDSIAAAIREVEE